MFLLLLKADDKPRAPFTSNNIYVLIFLSVLYSQTFRFHNFYSLYATFALIPGKKICARKLSDRHSRRYGMLRRSQTALTNFEYQTFFSFPPICLLYKFLIQTHFQKSTFFMDYQICLFFFFLQNLFDSIEYRIQILSLNFHSEPL